MKQDQVRILDEFAQTILAEAVPLEGEMEEKEEFLKELEECCREIMPTAKLYPFGSYVSGFATRGSDIDCAFTSGTWSGIDGQGEEWKAPKGFPEELKRKLMEAGYEATLLKKTRVPIIKLVKKPTEKVPHKIECDVGFSNFLAVHNTNLLKRYAEWDGRVVGMVRFIKVCSRVNRAY